MPPAVPRALILVLALIQSLLLLLFHEGQKAGWAAFQAPQNLSLMYTLALASPAMLMLLIRELRDAFSWLSAAGLSLVLLPLALHSGAANTAYDSPIFNAYTLSLTLALFILAAFLQNRRDRQGLHYPGLFHHAWDNALTVAATAVFVGAGWLILWLAAGLFRVIGVNLVMNLIERSSFAYPITGLMVGLGIAVSRTQPGALRASLRLCFALCRLLLPCLAVLALAFALTLPFTGLDPLWHTGRAAALLLALLFALVTLTNAVAQDLTQPAEVSRWMRLLLSAGLLSLPMFALLASYALHLRVAQYGWTVERCYAALVCVIAVVHAFGYAMAALRRGPVWLGGLARNNIIAAGLLVALLLLAQSPLLDFRAITAHALLQKALADPAKFDRRDLQVLRWGLGPEGIAALRTLKADPRVQADSLTVQHIAELLEQDPSMAHAYYPSPLVAAHFQVLPAGAAIPDDLLALLNAPTAGVSPATGVGSLWVLRQCADSGAISPPPCVLVRVDLDADGTDEWVAGNRQFGGNSWPFFRRDASGWRHAGELQWVNGEHSSTIPTAPVRVRPSPWQDLELGGQRLRVVEESAEDNAANAAGLAPAQPPHDRGP